MSADYTNTKVPHLACLRTSSPHPHPPTPPWAVHFSSGRKALRRARPQHRTIKIIELAPCRHPPQWPGLATLHSSETGAEGGREREEELRLYPGREAKPKNMTSETNKKKMWQDLLVFYSMNQRFYLTRAPHVISITLTIPKITKDYFSLHGLCEWW